MTGTSFNRLVDYDDRSGNDGFSGLVDNDRDRSMSGLGGSLSSNAVLSGLDGETGANSVMTFVENTEEGVVGLGELRGQVEVD